MTDSSESQRQMTNYYKIHQLPYNQIQLTNHKKKGKIRTIKDHFVEFATKILV